MLVLRGWAVPDYVASALRELHDSEIRVHKQMSGLHAPHGNGTLRDVVTGTDGVVAVLCLRAHAALDALLVHRWPSSVTRTERASQRTQHLVLHGGRGNGLHVHGASVHVLLRGTKMWYGASDSRAVDATFYGARANRDAMPHTWNMSRLADPSWRARVQTIVQTPGDVVFVPATFAHAVHNTHARSTALITQHVD